MSVDRAPDIADVPKAIATEGFFADRASTSNPPHEDDPYEVRAAWARAVVDTISAQVRAQQNDTTAAPEDIRPTHFWEVEFQSALVDPVQYARSMRAVARAH